MPASPAAAAAPSSAPARPLLAQGLTVAMHAIGGGLGWSIIPPLLPEISRDVGLTPVVAGLVWGAAPLGIALASPFGGSAVDRFGARWTAGLAMLAGALCCALRAWAHTPLALGAVMFLFGLHIAFVAPAIPKALASHVPVGKIGGATGRALLGYTLGTALTVVLARTVLAPLAGGWRPAMLLAAAAMLLCGIAWLLLMRDRVARAHHAGPVESLRLARDPQLARVALMYLLLFGGYLAMLGDLPRALLRQGIAPGHVGPVVAGWLLVAGVANAVGPWLSDRLRRRQPFLFYGSLVAGVALLGLAVLPSSAGLPLLWVAAAGGGVVAPLLLALPLEMRGVGPARAGAALGLLMLAGQAGGFLLPVLTGALTHAGGFALAMLGLALVHLLLLWPASGIRETAPGAAAVETTTPAAQLDTTATTASAASATSGQLEVVA